MITLYTLSKPYLLEEGGHSNAEVQIISSVGLSMCLIFPGSVCCMQALVFVCAWYNVYVAFSIKVRLLIALHSIGVTAVCARYSSYHPQKDERLRMPVTATSPLFTKLWCLSNSEVQA